MNVDPARVGSAARELLDRHAAGLRRLAAGHVAAAEARHRPAQAEAERLKDEFVSTEHLFIAIADEAGRSPAAQLLQRAASRATRIMQALTPSAARSASRTRIPKAPTRRSSATAATSPSSPRKGKLDPVIGRDEEIRRVIQVLSRRTKNNPVLIGEPGVGKTAIVEGLAQPDRPRRRARRAQEQADRRARHGRARRRREVPRRIRRAAEGGAQGDRRLRRARSSSSSTSCTPSSAPARPKGAMDASQHAEADARARRAAHHRRDDARRIPQAHRKGRGARAALPAGDGRRADGRGHDQHPARPARALRDPPRREVQGRGAGRGRGAVEPLHRRPVPARQGDRSGRRGGVEAADGDRFDAGGARRGRAPHHAARDRARSAAQGEGQGVAASGSPSSRRSWPISRKSSAGCARTGSRRRRRSRARRKLKEQLEAAARRRSSARSARATTRRRPSCSTAACRSSSSGSASRKRGWPSCRRASAC